MTTHVRPPRIAWDPATESRTEVWQRLKVHIHRQLDVIQARHRVRQRLERFRSRSTYPRNQEIYAEHLAGQSDQDLGRQFGLPSGRIREIVRMMRRHQHLADQLDPPPRARFRLASSRELDEDDPHLRPTNAVFRDP